MNCRTLGGEHTVNLLLQLCAAKMYSFHFFSPPAYVRLTAYSFLCLITYYNYNINTEVESGGDVGMDIALCEGKSFYGLRMGLWEDVMRLYRLESTDPYYNLAVEEHILRCWDEDVLLLWRNDNTIVVGRNQNTAEEIDRSYADANGINIIRRISGGGAVYHDLNNVNFSFIVGLKDVAGQRMVDFMAPIAAALNVMGVPVTLDGRNDLSVHGRKVSGNAQSIYKKRILHHGTLLFDVNLDVLSRSLRVTPEKFQSKATKSVRARVANIKDWLPGVSVSAFMERLQRQLASGFSSQNLVLREADELAVLQLRCNKYLSWDWNYGETPPFSFRNKCTFPGGSVEALLDIRHGIIEHCTFFGDFMARGDIALVTKELCGLRYQVRDVDEALARLPIDMCFGTLKREEILKCLFNFESGFSDG